MIWRCRERVFEDPSRVLVMGILNVTPDSFSDGGRYFEPTAAIARAHELVAAGADILDLGGESTRPGSAPVPAAEQVRRLLPVVQALEGSGACLSIDTTSAEVARATLDAGAHIINDVTALGDPAMVGTVAAAGAGLVLMHMQGTPATMQHAPHYTDVIAEVHDFLAARMELAVAGGVATECVALDPGLGFGKRLDHSYRLMARLDEIVALGRPVVAGASRKSFIGRVLDNVDPHDRLEGGLSAAAVMAFLGARIIRTHDVAPTQRAVRIAAALVAERRA